MRAIEQVAVVPLLLTITAPAVRAGPFKDDEGATHRVNSINEVPEKYRAGAVGGPVPKAQPSRHRLGAEDAREADQRLEGERPAEKARRAADAYCDGVRIDEQSSQGLNGGEARDGRSGRSRSDVDAIATRLSQRLTPLCQR